MQRVAYFCITAGVAVAGAGLIAIAPGTTRPLSDVEVPAIELSSDSAPNIDQQYLQWWQIVTGDTSGPPSLNELNFVDEDLLIPSGPVQGPLTLEFPGIEPPLVDIPVPPG